MPDGKIVIDTELGTKSFDAQIKKLEKDLETMTKTLESEAEIPVKLRMSESERMELETQIEKTRNRIISLQGQMADEEPAQKMSNSFKKTTSSLKKFALSLVSVGSIFALVSKASSAYLSQNTELANKLQSVWVGLGSFLAPIIEMISDALLKALGYLNVFVKALTGVDFIAKANAKALEKQATAQKKLNQETQKYDFDVVRTQQQQTSSSDGVAGGTSGLINIPELDENLVKKLQDLAYWLKENWGWIKLVGEALLVTFGAVKIAGLLKNIGSLIGSTGIGLTGLSTLLMGLATVFVITIAIKGWLEVFEQVEKLNEALKENTSLLESNTKEAKKSTDEWLKRYQAGVLNEEQVKAHTQGILDQVFWLEEHYNSLEKEKDILGVVTGKNKELTKQQQALSEEMMILINHEEELYNQGLLNEKQTISYVRHLQQQIKIQEELGNDTTELRKKYKELTSTTYYIKAVATVQDDITGKLNNILNVAKQKMSSLFSSGSIPFAGGGIVTQPTRALIGEAGYPEAVVPMTDSYLSTLANEIARFGGGGSQPVNIYLDGRLIQRQISNKQDQISFAKNG
jgi:hypothetical protein